MPRRKSTSPRARRAPPAAVADAFSRLKSLVRPRKPSGGEVSDADAAQIERDVGRSGAADQAQLRRVLRACCARAGYCQGINLLAARVLNSGVETATATDMLVQLREELPPEYWGSGLSVQREITAATLCLARQRCRSLSKQEGLLLGRAEALQLRAVALSWLGALFASSIPDETLATLLALLLAEPASAEAAEATESTAVTVLIGSGLAIIERCQAEVVAAIRARGDLAEPLVAAAATLTPDALERTIRGIQRGVAQQAVGRARDAARAAVQLEDAELSAPPLSARAWPPDRKRSRRAVEQQDVEKEDSGGANKQAKFWSWALWI